MFIDAVVPAPAMTLRVVKAPVEGCTTAQAIVPAVPVTSLADSSLALSGTDAPPPFSMMTQRGGTLVGRMVVPHPVWNEIGVGVAESPIIL
jgi:hypothetical protein